VSEEHQAAKRKRKTYPDDYKAAIVKRALEAKESGKETILAIAKEQHLRDGHIHQWIRAAKATKKPRAAKKKARRTSPPPVALHRTNGHAAPVTNGHSPTDKVPLGITGLRDFLRAEVRLQLREMVKEELGGLLRGGVG
jgi:transposase-like protein